MGSIDKIISEQILTWSKQQEIANKKKEKPTFWPVITISREYGALGKSLASEIGRRTGFKVWNKALLGAISEKAGADEQFLASLDEHRRKLIEDTLYSSFMGSKISNTHYFKSLLSVVKTISEHGSSIIVGRGSNYIIKSQNPLRVRIVSPIQTRISFIMQRDKITQKEAQKYVITHDTERRDFVKHYFKKDIDNAHDYDIILNSGIFNIEKMVDIIIHAYEIKVGKSLPILV